MNDIQRIRPFLGANDFDLSRRFYVELGFAESVISPNMSVFNAGPVWFYLQDYYVKEWVENTMVFLEVGDVAQWRGRLVDEKFATRFAGVRISTIQENDWGREFFVHDPAGNLCHIGAYSQ